MKVEEVVAKEVAMYVEYCELAAEHEPDEQIYKNLAHVLFYHIQEIRATGKVSYIPQEFKDSPMFKEV